jgi:hypothetical protein
MSNKSGRAAREEREKNILLKHKYENRITTVRFGKESLDVSDWGNALSRWTDYLKTIAEAKKAKDIYSLRIQHFDPKRELTEMLMISHLYFEMARMYDAHPKFHEESRKCLDQFVHFSANQPYQVVNSELMRKWLKKSAFKNEAVFRQAYQQIFVQSRKCYIVTFCFGEEDIVTKDCRLFKDWLLERSWGLSVVETYYRHSSIFVPRLENSTGARLISRIIVRPILLIFSKLILPRILKSC